MSKPAIPDSLRRAGITGFTHNLPAGFEVDFSRDFVRIFKEEIERRGQAVPAAESPVLPAGRK